MLSILFLAAAFAQPAPKPVPADKPLAVITDDQGKPLPAKLDGVKAVYFSAEKSVRDPGTEIFWLVFPESHRKDARKFPPNQGMILVVPTPEGVTLTVYQVVAKTVGKDAQSNVASITLPVNGGSPTPKPPVPPQPPTPPEPKPPLPPPVPTGFRVLIIRESADALSAARTSAMFAGSIRKYLNTKCAKSDNGHPEWRIYDDDTVIDPNESPTMRELFQKALPTVKQLPAIVIAVDGKSVAQPLPETEAATLALLKSKGG